MKKIIYLSFILTLIFTSCKNDEEIAVANKIVGKWTIKSIHQTYTVNRIIDEDTTIIPNDSEYMDFRMDNKMYSYTEINSMVSINNYSFVDDNHIFMYREDAYVGYKYEVKQLTNILLILYLSQTNAYNANSIYQSETTIELYK